MALSRLPKATRYMEVSMLRGINVVCYTTTNVVYSWMAKNPGQSVVLTLASLYADSWHLCDIGDSSRPTATHSIVICTYGRPESLIETLQSLSKQTCKNFEVVLITEKGNLSQLRQKGLESATGDLVSFIDDDVYCPPGWAQSITQSFREGVLGVTGPTIITAEYRRNRDIFKYSFWKKVHDHLFLGRLKRYPGRLSSCGCPSMRSNDEDCRYEGEVDYLEACNMSVRRKEALDAGGFDRIFYKTSEWCEVDLALQLKKKGVLLYNQRCLLYHRPSEQGIYASRLSTAHRWDNFKHFQKKWVKVSLRRHLYWAWVWIYLKLKETQTI